MYSCSHTGHKEAGGTGSPGGDASEEQTLTQPGARAPTPVQAPGRRGGAPPPGPEESAPGRERRPLSLLLGPILLLSIPSEEEASPRRTPPRLRPCPLESTKPLPPQLAAVPQGAQWACDPVPPWPATFLLLPMATRRWPAGAKVSQAAAVPTPARSTQQPPPPQGMSPSTERPALETPLFLRLCPRLCAPEDGPALG